jgi:molybdate transport system substrate-binding protein
MVRWLMQVVAAAAALLALANCSATGANGPVVLAAASLHEALDAAADAWARQGHARPVISFAASSALARQIEAGAPADLFIPADEDWMDAVAARGGLRAGTRAAFLSNDLVLIAPAASPVTLAIGRDFPLAGALGNGRLAMADPAAVPAGRYGKEALTKLGVWPAVQGKVVRAENVRAALKLVEIGEAPLGVVYRTDALADPRVRIVATFPAASHAPIVYPIARLKTSTSGEAEGLRRFLLSPEGTAVFRRFGFRAP